MQHTEIGTTIPLKMDFDSAVARVTEALKAEGFGVLTEIDVKQTFKNKLGIDFRPYKILGACNPPFAHKSLTIAPEVGLLLPCNVTVSQNDDGKSEVGIVDPLMLLGVVKNPELRPVAEQVKERLDRVAAALEA